MRVAWDAYHVEPRLMGRYVKAGSDPVDWRGGLYDHLLWVLSEGRARLEAPSGRHEIAPGTCIWFKPSMPFTVQRQSARLTNYAVVFALRDRRGVDLPLDARLPDEVLADPEPGFALAVMRRLQDLASGAREIHRSAFAGDHRTCAVHLLTGLLMELDRCNDTGDYEPPPALGPTQAAVFRLARSIAEDPGSAPSAAEQARQLGITATHLCRVYREVLDTTPGTFVRRFRLRHAQRLLVESELSVSAIADRLGYQSAAYFSRQFKKATGLAPSAFRRQRNVSLRGQRAGGERDQRTPAHQR